MIAYTEKTGDGQADLILKNNYMEIEADWKKPSTRPGIFRENGHFFAAAEAVG